MHLAEKDGRSTFFWGLLSFAVSLLPFFLLEAKWGGGHPLRSFSDDSLLVWNLLAGLISGDARPFQSLVIPRMAAPFSPLVFSEGFPITEQLQLSILKGISFFLRDPIELGDFYYLAGYPLAAIAFYFSAIYLRVRPPIAFGLSLAFAYLPFHWIRYDHLFLSHYWVLAPAAAILQFSVGAPLRGRRDTALIGLASLFLFAWHAYYGFFFYGMLALIFLFRAIRERGFWARGAGLLVISGVAAGVALGVSTFHYSFARRHAIDPPAEFSRPWGEGRLYGMRASAVLFPVGNHRVPALASLRAWYAKQVPTREGVDESLGTLALFGIFISVLAFYRVLRRKKASTVISELGLCAGLVFLFASPWGVATALSRWVTPIFRCPNRISPMLGAFALFGVGIWISRRTENTSHGRLKLACWGVFLALFAVWDQVPTVPYDPKPIETVTALREFGARIDERVGKGSVLQLPVVPFPESPPVQRMLDYAHATGPLFSRSAQFSYGAWKGTRAFAQIAEVARDPLSVERLRSFGYSGLWIDRFGYPDSADGLIADLRRKLGRVPVESSDGRRVFFELP